MEYKNKDGDKNPRKTFIVSEGIFYFSRRTEQFVFFVLTLFMLLWGLLFKIGLL
jgi:hypothetical protein